MSMREPKPYKCPHCVKAFANNSYLSQHMRIHLGIKPFGPCQFCGKKFTQLSHLQQHLRTHTGEKPYKCKYANCDKSFSQLSNLQSHSRCHQADKPFKCNSCYKCFTDEATLLEHIPKHKESKHLKVHICAFCGKSYTQALYLEKHMAKHAERARAAAVASGGVTVAAAGLGGMVAVNQLGTINNPLGGACGGTGNDGNGGGSAAATVADLSRFQKSYYGGGDFASDGFDGLNQLGGLNQLQSEELALRQFQMAAAAAQQNAAAAQQAAAAATATTTAAAAYAAASSCYPSSATNGGGATNAIGIGQTTLSQLNFFQRSFQRSFAGADNASQQLRQHAAMLNSGNNGAVNNSSTNNNNGVGNNGGGGNNNNNNNGNADRNANNNIGFSFNMITPLENIKHFNQNAAAAAAAATAANFQ